MARRDYGAGSIIQRGDAWYLRWYSTDPLTGRRIRRSETFRGAKRDASKRLAQLTARTSDVDGTLVTLEQCIDRWRETVEHEKSTGRNYDRGKASIPAHVLAMPIASIRASHLAELIDAIEAASGVHRARLVHATISGALTQAWRWEWIAQNPARRVVPPAAPGRAPTQPSRAQVQQLLALVANQPQLYAWIMTSADVGGRPGEVLALRWSKVDLERAQIFVSQAIDPIDGAEKATKTKGKRTVAVSPATIDALTVWRKLLVERAESAGVELVADPFVFSDDLAGVRPWRTDLATKRFGRLKAKVPGLERVRLYDLRHFVATELIAAGVPAKTVSSRLGHTRLATTTDTYSHVTEAQDRDAAVVMGDRLRAD